MRRPKRIKTRDLLHQTVSISSTVAPSPHSSANLARTCPGRQIPCDGWRMRSPQSPKDGPDRSVSQREACTGMGAHADTQTIHCFRCIVRAIAKGAAGGCADTAGSSAAQGDGYGLGRQVRLLHFAGTC
jgi:hypothetical protein